MRRTLLGLATLLFLPVLAFAQAIDLARLARVTATGTRATFILWPRETTDAPYTVRDGDPATGWKTPPRGESALTLDLAPALAAPPAMARLVATWADAPAGAVHVAIQDHCGGALVRSCAWADPTRPLILDSPARGYCVSVIVNDPGRASLAELSVFAAPAATPTALAEAEATPLTDGVRIEWTATDPMTRRVAVHYLAGADDKPMPENLVDLAPARGPWEGPRPALPGVAALVPLAEDGTAGEAALVDLPVRETQTLAASGVVEGFYGQPWSEEERRLLIPRLGRLGLGLYIYGPKSDPLHRDRWREPYDAAAVARFAELRALGEAVGVTFSMGISPGKDMDTADPDERAVLVAKLAPFVDAGFVHFTLLMDDIEFANEAPIDGTMGAAHSDLANWLRGELAARAGREVALWFVPTVYSTQRQVDNPGGADYLDALAALHPEIAVMWTGTDTFSDTLDAADLADVTARIDRAPAIWDNEHATDSGDGFWGKIYLAPYTGRSADLVPAVLGIVANPSIPGATDRLTLPTYAAYLRNPAGYDPVAAMGEAVALETPGADGRELLLELMAAFYGAGNAGMKGIGQPVNLPMDAAIAAVRDVIPGGSFAEIRNAVIGLAEVAARMAVMQERMHHGDLATTLVDDLWVPADRMTFEGRALLWLSTWLGSVLAGTPDEAALARADDFLQRAAANRFQVSLFAVSFLRRYLEKNPPPALGFARPPIAAPTARAVVGESWGYLPSPGAEVAAYGLPGAVAEAGRITWTPTHPGVYVPVIMATTAAGWAWAEFRLVVDAAAGEPDDGGDDDVDVTSSDHKETGGACGCGD